MLLCKQSLSFSVKPESGRTAKIERFDDEVILYGLTGYETEHCNILMKILTIYKIMYVFFTMYMV